VSRHCERSEAIQLRCIGAGLLRRFAPRNDAVAGHARACRGHPRLHDAHQQRRGMGGTGPVPVLSSSAKAGDPVLDAASVFKECPACAGMTMRESVPRLSRVILVFATRSAL